MIKASKPIYAEPFQYDNNATYTIAFSLIFVGNIAGGDSWARVASGWNRLDVLGVSKRRYNSKAVGRGFRPGDGFLHYSTGEGLVIARKRNKHGEQVYHLRDMRSAERIILTEGIRTAERELRWRRNSYCARKGDK